MIKPGFEAVLFIPGFNALSLPHQKALGSPHHLKNLEFLYFIPYSLGNGT